ncbi:MAG: hypothetical protein JWL82_561 [Parcubacteria group bacterium]|nr:hypothetical protein [Parcubacteria group bacterium]
MSIVLSNLPRPVRYVLYAAAMGFSLMMTLGPSTVMKQLDAVMSPSFALSAMLMLFIISMVIWLVFLRQVRQDRAPFETVWACAVPAIVNFVEIIVLLSTAPRPIH